MKKIFFFAFIFLLSVSNRTSAGSFEAGGKSIMLDEENLKIQITTHSSTVEDFLEEQGIKTSDNDYVFPGKGQKLFSGTRVIIKKAKRVTVKDGNDTKEYFTQQRDVENALLENKEINFGPDDIVVPSRSTPLKDGISITLTHVVIKEEIRHEEIDFKTIANEDDKLGWREKKITQKGEEGINEVKYRVVYHNGKEISKKILEKTKIKDPVDEIATQGTFMKLGKEKAGQGTWYAFKGGLFAASTTIPRGGYAKVTNTDNGKTIIVQINDYGPQGKGRIIDLDKVAFAQIASLGAGVINVKVEQVLN